MKHKSSVLNWSSDWSGLTASVKTYPVKNTLNTIQNPAAGCTERFKGWRCWDASLALLLVSREDNFKQFYFILYSLQTQFIRKMMKEEWWFSGRHDYVDWQEWKWIKLPLYDADVMVKSTEIDFSATLFMNDSLFHLLHEGTLHPKIQMSKIGQVVK